MSNALLSLTAAVATTLAISGVAIGDEYREGTVQTHPSLGEVAVVSDAYARIRHIDGGIYVDMATRALAPGHVHTLWLVAINNLSACESTPCSSKDVLKRTTAVDADVGYAGGIVAGPDGIGSFSVHQPIGDLPSAWFGAGLEDAKQSEIHLVVNDHGPVLEGRLSEMMTTYRGGCTDESIPAPMPATARAQGAPGPNACRLVQFSILEPEVGRPLTQ